MKLKYLCTVQVRRNDQKKERKLRKELGEKKVKKEMEKKKKKEKIM